MRLILVILCYFTSLTATFSQTCTLQKWPYKLVDFSSMIFIDSLYNKIKSDSSETYNLLLFTRYGEVNKLEGLYISFDSTQILRQVLEGSIINNSVIKKANFKLTGKEIDYSTLNKLNDYCGYYLGECFSEITHQNSTMVLANGKSKLWVELDTLGGEISNIMDSDPRFKELNKLIKHLSK